MWVRVWMVAVATAGSLVGCADAGTVPAAYPTSATPVESHPSNAFLEPGWRISDETLETYREALAEIDERLAKDDESMRYGAQICGDIRPGRPDARVVNEVAMRFAVDAAVARKIVDAATSTICTR